jgi:hypothetical protein
MHIHAYEQQHLDRVLEQFRGHSDVFWRRNISATRHSLANAASAAGTSTDELMAVLDYRTRRAAARANAETTATHEAATELV